MRPMAHQPTGPHTNPQHSSLRAIIRLRKPSTALLHPLQNEAHFQEKPKRHGRCHPFKSRVLILRVKQLGAYCGAFKTSPCGPQSSNHSWAAPLVAPARSNPVTEPSEYKFASRAPVIRRSPTGSSKHPRSKTAHQGKLPVAFTNGKLNMSSSCAYRTQDPHIMRSGDLDNQYDEFLASFQHRIDGMTGQKGGWGF
jgi:hypothetical protein